MVHVCMGTIAEGAVVWEVDAHWAGFLGLATAFLDTLGFPASVTEADVSGSSFLSPTAACGRQNLCREEPRFQGLQMGLYYNPAL